MSQSSEMNFDKFVQWMFDSNEQEEKPNQKDENPLDALGLTKLFQQEEKPSTKQEEENPLDALGLTMKNEMTKLFACFEDPAAQETTNAALDDSSSAKTESCSDAIKVGALAQRISAKTAHGLEIPRDISQVETEAETETEAASVQSETETESTESQANQDQEKDVKMQFGIPKLDAWLKDADAKQDARKALAERTAANSWLDEEAAKLTARRKSSSWLDDEIAMLTSRRIHASRSESGIQSPSNSIGMKAMANGKVVHNADTSEEWNCNKLVPQGQEGHRRVSMKAASTAVLAALRLDQRQ